MTLKKPANNKTLINKLEKIIHDAGKLKVPCCADVLFKTNEYLIVSGRREFKIRIENTNNIFQPFGKTIEKSIPIHFPVFIDKISKKQDNYLKSFNISDAKPFILCKGLIINNDVEGVADELENHIEETFIKLV